VAVGEGREIGRLGEIARSNDDLERNEHPDNPVATATATGSSAETKNEINYPAILSHYAEGCSKRNRRR